MVTIPRDMPLDHGNLREPEPSVVPDMRSIANKLMKGVGYSLEEGDHFLEELEFHGCTEDLKMSTYAFATALHDYLDDKGDSVERDLKHALEERAVQHQDGLYHLSDLAKVIQDRLELEYEPEIDPELARFVHDRMGCMQGRSSKPWELVRLESDVKIGDRGVELALDQGWALMALIDRRAGLLRHAPEKLMSDRDFVIKAVGVNGRALEFVDEQLRADRGVVLKAVAQDGSAIEYASDDLKADPEVIRATRRSRGRRPVSESGVINKLRFQAE